MRPLIHASTASALLGAAAAAPAWADRPMVRHEPVGCFVAESHPRVSAVITPADQVAKARVFFRPESAPPMPVTTTSTRVSGSQGQRSGDSLAERDPLGGSERVIGAMAHRWYGVTMTRDGDNFTAVLPRPRMSVQKVRYYIEAVDAAAASVKDSEHVVEVVGVSGACGSRKLGETESSAQVVVEVPPGAPLVPPVPQGFSPVGANAIEGSVVERKSRHKALFLSLGAAALGGAALASQLSAEDVPPPVTSGPPAPGIFLVNTFPSSGGVVSMSRPFMEVRLRVIPPERVQGPRVFARLYSSSAPSRTCGTMRTNLFNLAPAMAQMVRLFILEEGLPCGPVDRVHAELMNAEGRVVLSTVEPDLAISLTFTP